MGLFWLTKKEKENIEERNDINDRWMDKLCYTDYNKLRGLIPNDLLPDYDKLDNQSKLYINEKEWDKPDNEKYLRAYIGAVLYNDYNFLECVQTYLNKKGEGRKVRNDIT